MKVRSVITPASINWGDGGVPVSNQFGDVYFSREDGLQETHHVFLRGNGLPQSWQSHELFVIGETGFGTGLNFLATWEMWRETRPAGGRLHFVSVEGFPLCKEDLDRVHRAWPQFDALSAQLSRQYPAPYAGYHRLHFTDDVTLTLIFGDVASGLRELEARVDCWFLDGFAPAKNPEMWSAGVFHEMARLSAPKATLATFSVAQRVRQGLADAGFEVFKRAGYGRKREMLGGMYAGERRPPRVDPWYRVAPCARTPQSVAIAGGGIAGAALASAWSKRGVRPTVFDRHSDPAQEASATPSALFLPRLSADPTTEGHFYASAFLYAEREISRIEDMSPQACLRNRGILVLADTDKERARQMALVRTNALPEEHMTPVSKVEAEEFAGVRLQWGGLFYLKAGSLNTPVLVRALLERSEFRGNTFIQDFRTHNGLWSMVGRSGDVIDQTDAVIFAAGAGFRTFSHAAGLPLNLFRGQVSHFDVGVDPSGLKLPLMCGQAVVPSADGSILVGSTYEQIDAFSPLDNQMREADHALNRSSLERILPDSSPRSVRAKPSGWAGVRCSTLDLHPVAGPMFDEGYYRREYELLRHGSPYARYPDASYHAGLYALLGLGSRGFTTAFLCAELLVSQALGEPWPVERSVAALLHPARFLVRELKRVKP